MSTGGGGGFQISITPRAAKAFREVLAQQPPGSAVRVFVLPGPHPRPNMSIEKPRPHEPVLQVEGIPLLVDEVSEKFLAEAVIDHLDSPGSSGFHIEGPNVPTSGAGEEEATGAPPSGPTPPSAEPPTASASPSAVNPPRGPAEREAMLRQALRKIYDPEIPMNILDLGLIYRIDWPAEGKLHVRMTMTSPGCPVAGLLHDQVEEAARAIPGVREVEVEIVWEPAWGPEKMSAFARRQFGYE